ncbi:MAG TPA: hypothetical protein VGN34_33910 [Ktedonobacteraceae bacterium]|jgi:hypothetical protein
MTLNTSFAPGSLTFTNVPVAQTLGVVPATSAGQPIAFSFGSNVLDQRNTKDGWELGASSAGLVSADGTMTIPLQIVTSSSVCTPTSPSSNTCVSTTPLATPSAPITLTSSSTPQAFLTTGPPANVISGAFAVQTAGQYIIPNGAPAGAYSATITISLENTFS